MRPKVLIGQEYNVLKCINPKVYKFHCKLEVKFISFTTKFEVKFINFTADLQEKNYKIYNLQKKRKNIMSEVRS